MNKQALLAFMRHGDGKPKRPMTVDEIRFSLDSSIVYTPSQTRRVLQTLLNDGSIQQTGETYHVPL